MVDHSGIEKKFPSYFSKFRLPEEASENALVVYRACKTQMVDKESFTPSYEESGFAEPTDPSNPKEYSLSVYEDPKDMRRFAGLTNTIRPPMTIAKGITAPCCGLAQRTSEREKRRTVRSHVDWWLYEQAQPHMHFEIIDDFKAYIGIIAEGETL